MAKFAEYAEQAKEAIEQNRFDDLSRLINANFEFVYYHNE
jgi:hypothetical protein